MSEPSRTAKLDWRPTLYNQAASAIYSNEHTEPLFELLSAQPGERIIDLGCGTGELTLRLERLVGNEGVIVGIDASESMLVKAKENGVANLFLGDIQNLVVPHQFKHLIGTSDVVFTNATLHWCKQDPLGAIKTAKNFLKPGGRFVGEFCGHMNGLGVRCVTAHVLERRGKKVSDPWFMPQPTEYAKLLESEGFMVEHISLNPRVITFPGSMLDFLRVLLRISFLKDLEDEEAEDIIQEVGRICEFDHKDGTGTWSGMYVTIRFRAIAPI